MRSMTTSTEDLNAEQSNEWGYYLHWYLDNGWVGANARELAWRDFCKKYPKFTGKTPPSPKPRQSGKRRPLSLSPHPALVTGAADPDRASPGISEAERGGSTSVSDRGTPHRKPN